MATTLKSIEISPGVYMPLIGLGTYKTVSCTTVEHSVDTALSAGYRLIDTAQMYGKADIGDNILVPFWEFTGVEKICMLYNMNFFIKIWFKRTKSNFK